MTTLLIFAHFMKVNEVLAKEALEHLLKNNPKTNHEEVINSLAEDLGIKILGTKKEEN